MGCPPSSVAALPFRHISLTAIDPMTTQPPIQFERGERTTINNPNAVAWRVSVGTTGGTRLEFDVIVGGSFTITAGSDIDQVDIRLGDFDQPPQAVG